MIDFNSMCSKKLLSTGSECGGIRVDNDNELLDFSKDYNESIDDRIMIGLKDGIFSELNVNDLEFKKSCSAHLRVEQFVDIDYKSEIGISNGNTEALRLILLAFINKGDYIISTTPSNRNLANIAKWVDASVYEYKLTKFNNYLIDFEDIDESILRKCKLLYINYPNNSTGVIGNKKFFKEVIKYAKKYNFIVVNDANLIDLCFDEFDKTSFLSVEGAKDVGIELYDFSSSFNMNKYKIGFIYGNKEVIKIYDKVKEELEVEHFDIALKMAVEALNNYESITNESRKLYIKRYSSFKEILEKYNFKVKDSKVGPYLYAQIPFSCNGVQFENSVEFSKWLKENQNIIVKPCDGCNEVRLSMNYIVDEDSLITNKFEDRLNKYKFENKQEKPS